MYSNNSEFSRVYDNFKCLYKKSLDTYRKYLMLIEKIGIIYTIYHFNLQDN